MPKKTTAARAKKPAAKAKPSAKDTYLRLRQQIESMKELHAVVLVIMVSLVAGMFMILAKQKQEIAELQFKVEFINQRYNIWRDKGLRDIEANMAPVDDAQ